MNKCPKCGNSIGFHHLVSLLLLLRSSFQCKKCSSRIICINANTVIIICVSMFLSLQIVLKKVGHLSLVSVFSLLICFISIVLLPKLTLNNREKDDASLLLIAPTKHVFWFYRYGWLLGLAISTIFIFLFLLEEQTSRLVWGLFFLLISVYMPFLFRKLLFTIEASDIGLRKINYKGVEEAKIDWMDIISVERPPIKIPIVLRLIKSDNGDMIDVGTDQKGYGELIELIRKKAINIRKIVE